MGITMDGIFTSDSPIVQLWGILSLPIIFALFFRFGRVWSVRNLDLVLLLAIAVGTTLGPEGEFNRTAWLITVTVLLLVRLLCDSLFRRRPRIDANLNPPGLAVLGATGFGLMVAATFAGLPGTDSSFSGSSLGGQSTNNNLQVDGADAANGNTKKTTPPTTAIIKQPLETLTKQVAENVQLESSGSGTSPETKNEADKSGGIASKILVVIGHLSVIVALIFLGAITFSEPKSGAAMAALYCLLPCTVMVPRSIEYILPSALILWAFAAHRRPIVAGVLLGLACGTHMFPFVLIPIWLIYYGRKNGIRFSGAFLVTIAVLFGSFAIVSTDAKSFLAASLGSVEVGSFWVLDGQFSGWSLQGGSLALFSTVFSLVALLIGLSFWPRKKTLEHLLAHSATIVVAVFLWYSYRTDWFLPGVLPFLILIAYRPMISIPAEPPVPSTPASVEKNGRSQPNSEPAIPAVEQSSLFR